jgi:hypothetical protein
MRVKTNKLGVLEDLAVTSQRPLTLCLLIALILLLAVGGFYGGVTFLVDPSGELMGLPASFLALLPVPDYTLPGLFLVIVMGIAPTILLYGLFVRPRWAWITPFVKWSGKHWSWTGTLYLGIVLILWLIIEGWLIGFTAPVQIFTAFHSVAILLLTIAPPVMRYFQLEKILA